jgi:hypothetical protein
MNGFSYCEPKERMEQLYGVFVLTELRKLNRDDYRGEYAIVIPDDCMEIC